MIDPHPIVLVAMGGHAFMQKGERGTIEDHERNAVQIASLLMTLVERNYYICVTHGNGPPVGNLLLQQEHARDEVPSLPLDVLVAMTEGSLGYILQQALLNELRNCLFIWGSTCTAPRCWSFETEPAIKLTRLMETLAHCEDSYRYVNTDIKFSYAFLRKDGMRKENVRLPGGSKFLRLSKLHLHVGKRINVAGGKMSGELGDARSHVFKLCDGTAKTPVYAVLPSYHITPENDLITSAPYGSILELRNVLVRYNRTHDAYNLLVSRNTKVTFVKKS